MILEKQHIDFEQIYLSYFSKMKRFAREYVLSDEDAENIVQDVFLDFWEKKELLPLPINILAYLFTSIKNRCIDFLRHKIVQKEVENKNQSLQTAKATKQAKVNSLSAEEKELQEKIDEFEAAIKKAEKEIQQAAQDAANSGGGYVGSFEGTLSWPLSSNTSYYNYISSYFGPRESPTSGASSNHGAVDIPVRYAPVYAPADGRVIIAWSLSGYGNYIMIDHGNGYYTGFGHLSSYNVSAGQTVSRGQQIAVSGNTGISTGPHLHYEVYIGGTANSYRVDPLQYTTHPTLYSL